MRTIVALTAIVMAFTAKAQYFQFSQYNFAQQRISPTMVANSDYARVSILYRNQLAAGGVKLSTNFLSASYPLIARNGKRWSGIGITIMDDRSAGIFNFKEVSASYAVNLPISKTQHLSFGIKALLEQRKLDLSGLVTESQFIADRGFDPSLNSGEPFGIYNNRYTTFSSGIAWQKSDKYGTEVAYLTISIFDLNKPNDSFLDDQQMDLSSTMVFSMGLKAYQIDKLSFHPELLLSRQAATTFVNVGCVTRYTNVDRKGKTLDRIDLLTKYVPGRSAVAGLQFHNAKFGIGFSYDLLANRRNTSNLNAFEVAFELHRLISKQKTTVKQTPSRKPVAREPKKIVTPTKAAGDSLSPARLLPPGSPKNAGAKEKLSEKLHLKSDSITASAHAGSVKHEPLVLEKVILRFNFEFNSIRFTDDSRAFMDDLAQALQDDKHLSIKLTGHTDNVGSVQFNQKLSLLRAQVIRDYLVSKGIDKSRIETEGQGMDKPLNSNRTEKDRAENRRVELTIFYKQ